MRPLFVSFQKFKGQSRAGRWKMLARVFVYAFGAGILLVAGIFLYLSKDLPSPSSLGNRTVIESTKIYDRTGAHILYDIHGEEKRTQIPFQEMPDTLKYATISLEDQNFYSNPGVEITAIIRAGLADVFHLGAKQGGSTITQQLIKQTVLSAEKTFTRKIKEAILSIELSQKFSKDEILGMYLNQIPYGSNAYGLEAAAQTFFGKHAKELTLEESALLAALPKAPSYYSPYGNHTDALRGRQVYALNQMAKLGYITQEQADGAKEVDIFSKIKAPSENISAPHFVMYVKEYLENKYGEQAVEKGGMKVYTTLDWDKQQVAEQAVREGAESNLKKYNAENAALVAIDPKTGQILSMVGSKNYFDKSIDGQVNVAIRDRQPGSSFKPYVYLAAFSKGYSPETQLWDVHTNFSTDSEKGYAPKNYDGKNHGLLQMKNALAMSLNVPAVKTLYLAGVNDSVNLAKSLGITTLNKPDNYGLSLVLGGGEVKLLDHVSAFASLATGGVRHDKTAILKIVDSSGTTLEEYTSNDGQRVIDEKYVTMLNYIMSTNELRAPVFGDNNPLKFSDRSVAAKTGTTNEWRDGWTMGYTPSLAVGVWSGNNDNSKMAAGADGIYTAAPIWRKFMDGVLKNYNIEHFPKYEKLEDSGKDILDGKLKTLDEVEVCSLPGKKDEYCLATAACPDSQKKKKTFFTAHTILYYVKKDDPRGEAPKKPEDDPQYKGWEKALQKWADKEKDFKNGGAPKDECQSSDFESFKPSASISSPSNGQTITAPTFTITGSISAEFGIKNSALLVNGAPVASPTGDFSYSHTAPSGVADITIQLKVTDINNNDASSSITVHTNIP